MELLNEDFKHAQSLVSMAKQNLVKLVQEHQAICPHEDVAECDYRPEGLLSYAQPPIRMCIYCGISEEGWRLHKILREPKAGLRKWSRDDLIQARIGEFHMRDGDVCWID